MPDPTDREQRIRELSERGELEAARRVAADWVGASPGLAEAHNTLGKTRAALKDFAGASSAFRRATELDPTMAKALSNLGSSLRSCGDLEGAIAALRRAVALDSANPRAWSNLGNALRQSGAAADAKDAYLRSLARRPAAQTHFNVGTLLTDMGRAAEAAEHLERGLRLEPEGPLAAMTRAALVEILVADGRPSEAALVAEAGGAAGPQRVALARSMLMISGAERAAESLVGFEPGDDARGPYAEVMARIEEARGDLTSAERFAVTAAGSLGTAIAWCEVARLRGRRSDRAGLEEALQRAEEAEPTSSAAALYRGEDAMARNDLDAAETAFSEAVRKAPGLAEPVGSLALVALRRGDGDAAVALLRKALSLRPGHAAARSNLLLTLHYRDRSQQELLQEHLEWNRCQVRFAKSVPFAPRPGAVTRRLRVGYVSTDLREHAVARLFEALLASHDRSRFELFLYDLAERSDATTERLAGYGDTWRHVHATGDAELTRIIRDDMIDVLVDLGGHTAGSRLSVFAARPAPVMATFLGYPDTTGVAAIDVRITDEDADPPGAADRHATEALVRLPRCAWCFHPDLESPSVMPRPPGAPIVFAVFNNVAKITDVALRAFAELLRRIPESRLLMKGRTLRDAQASQRFFAPFAEAGVEDRVELRSWAASHADHLATYHEVDIALDTFPYAGTTTTCEALWMGVPTVTLAGDHHAARVGVSLLRAVGLDDLVADDLADYVERAAELAQDRERLAHLRATMRDRVKASPLRDGTSYARAVEEVYVSRFEAWRSYAEQTGGAPDVWLPLPDGAVISAPDDLACATRFVLEEQGDWFEREVGFVRELLQEGEVAVDVGANFGVYSATLARRVGPRGSVLAFEPAPRTAAHLRRTAQRLSAIRVVQAAAGEARGSSRFDLGPSPELAQLTGEETERGTSIDVDVLPLDDFVSDLRDLAFAKVDAEGAETRVLAGARKLLAREDPVWMWELRHGSLVNQALIEALAERAPHLQLMRWVGPLGALVPFDPKVPVDQRWLNVIALSPARRRQLMTRGLSVRGEPRELLSARGSHQPYDEARAAHAASLVTTDPSERFDALCKGLGAARQAHREKRSASRAFTLARLAHELGHDGEATAVLDEVLTGVAGGAPLRLDEAGLLPLPSQDARRSEMAPEIVVEAFAIEARLTLGAWSSFYALDRHEAWLERLATLGALTPRLQRVREAVSRLRARTVRT